MRRPASSPSRARTFVNKVNATAGAAKIVLTESQAAALSQRRAYEYYRQKSGIDAPSAAKPQAESSLHDRNVQIASYATAAVNRRAGRDLRRRLAVQNILPDDGIRRHDAARAIV